MGVTPASATGMMQQLGGRRSTAGRLSKTPRRALTAEGRRHALEVIRHHRLLETFLHEKLGYTWDEVHAEADRLEHVISEELEERIARPLATRPSTRMANPSPPVNSGCPQRPGSL